MSYEERERKKILKEINQHRKMKQEIKGELSAEQKLGYWDEHKKQLGSRKKLEKWKKEQ